MYSGRRRRTSLEARRRGRDRDIRDMSHSSQSSLWRSFRSSTTLRSSGRTASTPPSRSYPRKLEGARSTKRSEGLSYRKSQHNTNSGASASASASAGADAGSRTGAAKLCCDACDGNHETARCPYYKKKRGDHPDERKGKGRGIGDGTGGELHSEAISDCQAAGGRFLSLPLSVIRAWRRNLRRKTQARNSKLDFPNGHVEIADSPLSDWIRWESSSSVAAYARRMARGGVWGGGIEMASCSLLYRVNVHVYERGRGIFSRGRGLKRISCFEPPGKASRTVHVLYGGRVHFDAIDVL